MAKVAASILTCNLTYLGEAVLAAQAGGADYLHVDVIDGKYAGNYSFGPKVVQDLKKIVDIPIEVHLELFDPEHYIEHFVEAGADMITIQSDSTTCPIRALKKIKSLGKKAGLGISPAVGVHDVKYFVPHIDYLIAMSVEPGFGGQKMEETIFYKLAELKEILAKGSHEISLFVDGNVNNKTASKLLKAGADTLVIGSAIFPPNGNITPEEITKNVQLFKNII